MTGTAQEESADRAMDTAWGTLSPAGQTKRRPGKGLGEAAGREGLGALRPGGKARGWGAQGWAQGWAQGPGTPAAGRRHRGAAVESHVASVRSMSRREIKGRGGISEQPTQGGRPGGEPAGKSRGSAGLQPGGLWAGRALPGRRRMQGVWGAGAGLLWSPQR